MRLMERRWSTGCVPTGDLPPPPCFCCSPDMSLDWIVNLWLGLMGVFKLGAESSYEGQDRCGLILIPGSPAVTSSLLPEACVLQVWLDVNAQVWE